MEKEEFYTSQVLKVTSIKQVRLHQWIERGYVTPSIQSGQGTGSKNIFSRNDLYQIEYFKRLTEGGMSREHAARIVKGITGEGLDVLRTGGINPEDIKKHKVKIPKGKYEYLVLGWTYIDGKRELTHTLWLFDIEDQWNKGKKIGYDNLEKIFPDVDEIHMVNIQKLKNDVDKAIKEKGF